MTLVLCLGNRQNVTLLSDRRLTVGDTISDDESNKATLLVTKDARVAVGYTGIAGLGKSASTSGPPAPGEFRTSFWILEALRDSAPPEETAAPLANRFLERCNSDINALAVPLSQRGLLVGLAGYSYNGSTRSYFLRTISNLDEHSNVQSGFQIQETPDGEPFPPAFMLAYGTRAGLDPDGMIELGKLVQDLKPPTGLINKAAELMREAARSARSRKRVGENLNALSIPSDPSQPAVATYLPDHASPSVYMPNLVDVPNGLLIGDAAMHLHDGVAATPKVGRNQPCPCGSGKKYKFCHGSHR